MKTPVELNGLTNEIHKNAVDHGWWDRPREFGEVVALIHSELSEALEEYREGHDPAEIYTNCKMDEIKAKGGGGCGVCTHCPANKPEGIAVELADAVIRILDWFGQDEVIIPEYEDLNSFEWESFGCFIADCHEAVSAAYTNEESKENRTLCLYGCISAIFVFLRKQEIDPIPVILEKMEYNKTRPYRHGGKKC